MKINPPEPKNKSYVCFVDFWLFFTVTAACTMHLAACRPIKWNTTISEIFMVSEENFGLWRILIFTIYFTITSVPRQTACSLCNNHKGIIRPETSELHTRLGQTLDTPAFKRWNFTVKSIHSDGMAAIRGDQTWTVRGRRARKSKREEAILVY